jgi:DNA-binding NarL/FixJ family response regulator
LKIILESDPDIKVAGTGNSGSEALSLYRQMKPDVLLMDIRMDGMTGLEAAESILKDDPNAKILFLTTFSDYEYIAKAFQIGAKGYILKQNYQSIIPSVKAVFLGQRVFGDEIMSKLPAFGAKAPKDFKRFDLSDKEIEIMTLVAKGLSNKEISETLFLGEGTVVYTSHYMEEVEQICSRIMILDKGKAIALGTKEQLKDMITLGEKITVEAFSITDEQIQSLKSIPNVLSVHYSGNLLVIQSGKGRNNLEAVLDFIKKEGIQFGKIYSELPTLNDVFLEITGKELRD